MQFDLSHYVGANKIVDFRLTAKKNGRCRGNIYSGDTLIGDASGTVASEKLGSLPELHTKISVTINRVDGQFFVTLSNGVKLKAVAF